MPAKLLKPTVRVNIAGATSLSEQAYRLIRRMIVRLQLAPGAVIREDELQQKLGIGRTPIREALQRLARDQFLVVIPRRGMIVSSGRRLAAPSVFDVQCSMFDVNSGCFEHPPPKRCEEDRVFQPNHRRAKRPRFLCPQE